MFLQNGDNGSPERKGSEAGATTSPCAPLCFGLGDCTAFPGKESVHPLHKVTLGDGQETVTSGEADRVKGRAGRGAGGGSRFAFPAGHSSELL